MNGNTGLQTYNREVTHIQRSTGFEVEAIQSLNNGFYTITGIRKFKNLIIKEGLLVASNLKYITEVQVYSEADNTLIIEKAFPQKTKYTRQLVSSHISQKMADYICKENSILQRKDIMEQVNEIIELGYFQKSYQAAYNWAQNHLVL